MEKGNFYFIDEQYFIDFPDPYLEKNREILNGSFHDRPYYYAVKDARKDLYWMIPISSKVKKYRKVYNEKSKKYESSFIKYLASEEAKLEKLLENQELFLTPIVRNGKKATLGYCPEEWKKWASE